MELPGMTWQLSSVSIFGSFFIVLYALDNRVERCSQPSLPVGGAPQLFPFPEGATHSRFRTSSYGPDPPFRLHWN